MIDESPATICVIDDDAGVRKAVARLLRAEGFDVRAYFSPQEYLDQHHLCAPACLVLDFAMPGLNGLELQQMLARTGQECSIVFLTGQGSIPLSVRAIKAGAIDFLTKPVDDEQLLAAVRNAVEVDRRTRFDREERNFIAGRLETLTDREHE